MLSAAAHLRRRRRADAGLHGPIPQRLSGRLDQSRLGLAPWQKIAEPFFGGTLHKLIQDHPASPVAPIHAEGAVIARLELTVQSLQNEMAALHGSSLPPDAEPGAASGPRSAAGHAPGVGPHVRLSAQALLSPPCSR